MKNNRSNWIAITLISLYLIIPILLTFIYSIFSEWNEILPKGLTFKYYVQIFTDSDFLSSLLRSLIITILPIILSTIMMLLVMYVVIVYHPNLDKYIQTLCTIPYAIQGVILAVSVLSLYADAPLPFSNRMFMLTATYCIVTLPYMYQGIKNSLNSINATRLMEAAQILGTSKFSAYFKIVIPNITSGIIVSAMLSLAIIFGDFVIINIIGGNYFKTSQMYLYLAMGKSGQFSSAIVVVLFMVTLLISVGVYVFRNEKSKE